MDLSEFVAKILNGAVVGAVTSLRGNKGKLERERGKSCLRKKEKKHEQSIKTSKSTR